MSQDSPDAENPYEPPQAEVFTAQPAENPFRRGDELVVQFDRTVEDWITLSMRLHGERQTRSGSLRLGLLAIVLFGVGLGFFFNFGLSFPILVLFVLAALLGIFAIPPLMNRRLRKAYANLYQRGSLPGMQGPVEISISPRGVHEISETGESLTYWGAIERVDLSLDGVRMPISHMKAIYVPARVFGEGRGLAEFVAEAERLHAGRRLAT